MTIGEATQNLRTSLESIYDLREAANIANLVMENLTGLLRVDRVVQKHSSLSEAAQFKFGVFTSQLREHRPVQYVLNEAWFFGMKFYVDEHVLIPRPETEELVEWVLQDAVLKGSIPDLGNSAVNTVSIVDLGTGSGCIPIALKKKKSSAEVSACDISLPALEIAVRNAYTNSSEIVFLLIDVLDPSATQHLPEADIIVSNPPYIPSAEKTGMDEHVRNYEPGLALFVPDQDPTIFYKAIAAIASYKLKPGGSVYLEIHDKFATAVSEVLKLAGLTDVTIRKDLQGRDRMMRGRRKYE